MSIHILGCGNVLRFDDGFGPAVAEFLQEHYIAKDEVVILDAGLACGEWLKPLIIDPDRPDMVIIVDVLDMGEEPGTVKIIASDDLEMMDLSMSSHLFPDKQTMELLQKQGIRVVFVSCQPEKIPDDIIEELSDHVQNAVPIAASKIADLANLEIKEIS